MKATEKKSSVGRLLGLLTVAIVIGGMTFLPSVADFDQGSGTMAILFVAFLGAIIAVQLIPGMMLFGMMIKGVASLFRKEEATKETE
jgi:Flp pilus assembly pilin Flp